MKHWILKWLGSSEAKARGRPTVAAVLPGVLPAEEVARIAGALYAASEYEPDEIVAYGVGRNPYPGSVEQTPHGPVVQCGHNPFLAGSLVSNLRVEGGRISFDRAT